MTLNIKKQLGLNIKNFRRIKGYTQESFAEAIGIAPRTLCLIEKGKNFLTADTLEKIVSVLKITPDELFTLNSEKSITERKNEIIEIINELEDSELVEKLYNVVKSLLV